MNEGPARSGGPFFFHMVAPSPGEGAGLVSELTLPYSLGVLQRLSVVNLAAAAAIALFGLYAWHQTHTGHVLVSHKGWSRNRSDGSVVIGDTELFFSKTTHPHALLAYVAWAVALVVAALSLWQLRRLRMPRSRPRPSVRWHL